MFYEKYVRLCNSVGKTPSSVALEMGIAKPTVTRWKNGSNPSSATLLKVADYFGVSSEFLTDDSKKEKPAPEIGSRLAEIEFIFSQLTPSRQTKLLELARLYLDDQRRTEETR